MIRRTLDLIAAREPDGRIILRSPGVGIFSGHPRPGEGLVPGSVAGTLTVLGRRIDLLVPEGMEGRVAPAPMKDRSVAVAWGQPLLELEPEPGARRAGSGGRAPAVDRTLASGAASGRARTRRAAASESPHEATRAGAGATASGGAEDLREGEHALRATTTGIFYLRPDPSSPPFASMGSTLETGQTAGLIEVMKCFSPIVHPGGSIPSPAIVERVSASEGQEVHPGQILFVLRSA